MVWSVSAMVRFSVNYNSEGNFSMTRSPILIHKHTMKKSINVLLATHHHTLKRLPKTKWSCSYVSSKMEYYSNTLGTNRWRSFMGTQLYYCGKIRKCIKFSTRPTGKSRSGDIFFRILAIDGDPNRNTGHKRPLITVGHKCKKCKISTKSIEIV